MVGLYEITMQGGIIFTLPVLLILMGIIVITAKTMAQKKQIEHQQKTIASLGLFCVAWGFLGQILGLISAFDSIESAGGVSMDILAGGLKTSFIAPVFGLVTFLLARICILLLHSRNVPATEKV